MEFKWSRFGGYECSTQGDSRFSAFNAILADGRSIEMHYQCCVKGFDPGGTNWRLGKGKPPLNVNVDLYSEYLKLWFRWACNNVTLMEELRSKALEHNGLLSDRFATGDPDTSVNQARALADLLNNSEYLDFA